MITKGDLFKTGEICKESGIYKLNCSNLKCIISKKQLTIPLVKGKRFPPCRNCDGDIQWEFIREA